MWTVHWIIDSFFGCRWTFTRHHSIVKMFRFNVHTVITVALIIFVKFVIIINAMTFAGIRWIWFWYFGTFCTARTSIVYPRRSVALFVYNFFVLFHRAFGRINVVFNNYLQFWTPHTIWRVNRNQITLELIIFMLRFQMIKEFSVRHIFCYLMPSSSSEWN